MSNQALKVAEILSLRASIPASTLENKRLATQFGVAAFGHRHQSVVAISKQARKELMKRYRTLREAAFAGNYTALKAFLAENPSDSDVLLYLAMSIIESNMTEKSKTAVVKCLLDYGIDVQGSDNDRETLLMYAAAANCTEIIDMLLKRGAKKNARDNRGKKAYMYAVDTDVMKLLFDSQVNLDGRTDLMIAASNNLLHVVIFLLEHGADPNVIISFSSESEGETALWMATVEHYPAIVKVLLEHDANPNIGDPPLHRAASSGHIRILRLLLKHGADVNRKDSRFGSAALDNAASFGRVEIVSILLDHGAHVDAQTKYGFTALMSAASSGYPKVVKLLLQHGAHVHLKDKHGETALDIALKKRPRGSHLTEVIEILKAYNA